MELVLFLYCSATMAWGKFDKLSFGASVVAALGFIGLARSDVVSIVCLRESEPSTMLGPLRGRSRIADMLRQLSQVGSSGRVDLNPALQACASSEPRQRLVVLVSDLLTPQGIGSGLDGLRTQHTDVVVLHVFSPEEQDPRIAGEVELVDSETHETLELGASLATLDAYRSRYARWLAEQESTCTSRGIRYVRLASNRAVESVVLDDLRRAEILR
jgi:hypothetical protein